MKSVFVFILLLFLFSSCRNDYNQIRGAGWKSCGEQPFLNDVIPVADEQHFERNDTLFIRKQAAALITKIENRYSAGDYVMFLISLDGRKEGNYCLK